MSRSSLRRNATIVQVLLLALVVSAVSGGAVAGVGGQKDAARAKARPGQVANARNIRKVGFSRLGGKGLNGEVALVGDTAVVGAGILPSAGVRLAMYNPVACPEASEPGDPPALVEPVTVKVVNISKPKRPRVASTIPVPEGVVAYDVDALRVRTPQFKGDLAAVALVACNFQPGQFHERGVAYYDVTKRSAPEFLGRYDADKDLEQPNDPPCGPNPGQGGQRCASSQHSVTLVQRKDGKVLSFSTEPFISPSACARATPPTCSGDLRIVDVTDPRNPVQVSSFPTGNQVPAGFGAQRGFSQNGCRPFDAGRTAAPTGGGMRALLAYYDLGMYILDIADPNAPAPIGQFTYNRANRKEEGNAAFVTTARVGRTPLALLSEEDYIAPESSVDITAPQSIAGSKFACESMFTLFDPEDTAQVYRKPDRRVSGNFVYLGRGCPANVGTTTPDPYLGDPTGKIALIDRARDAAKQPVLPNNFCGFAQKVKRAQEAGAVGVVFRNNSSPAIPEAFSPDGDPTDLTIPSYQIDRQDGEAIVNALCPNVVAGNCSGGQTVTGAMVDNRGQWGGMRILNIQNPAAPIELARYETPTARRFPPPDLGIYSVHHAVAKGSRVYVAANSDGVRVLDLRRNPRRPREIASLVPADNPDPVAARRPPNTYPAKTYVTGVDVAGRNLVITDIHTGLYVLRLDLPRRGGRRR